MMRAYKIGCEIDSFDDGILCGDYDDVKCGGFVATKASMSIIDRIRLRYAGPEREEILLDK